MEGWREGGIEGWTDGRTDGEDEHCSVHCFYLCMRSMSRLARNPDVTGQQIASRDAPQQARCRSIDMERVSASRAPLQQGTFGKIEAG